MTRLWLMFCCFIGVLLATPSAHCNPKIAKLPVRLISDNSPENSATKNIPSAAAYGVALGDFNNDAVPDFVSADQPGYFTLRLGTGDGNFRSARFFALAGAVAHALAVGDLNHDSKFDLVAVGAGKLTVVLGKGGGSFYVGRASTISQDTSVALADLNTDGILDLVAAGKSGIITRLGNGDGSFGPEKTYLAQNDVTGTLTVADINSDGKLDVLISGASSVASLRLGEGNGSLRSEQLVEVGIAKVRAHAVGDLNNDGNPDLVVVGSSKIATLIGRGNGSFAPANVNLASSDAAVALADLNGDGVLDLISSASSGLSLSLGNGDGTFLAPRAMVAQSGSSDTLLASDLNLDSKIDLIISGVNSNGVGISTVRFGEGNGTLHPSRFVSFINGIASIVSRFPFWPHA